MTDKTYFIHEDNMERLEKKLQRIKRKCDKYNCHFEYNKLGETYREVVLSTGFRETARFIEVAVSGVAIINWKFIATIETSPNGNIIKQYATDVEVPDFYKTCKLVCDHCNTKRARKSTYLIQNAETGEFKQVGKSCLADYTHGLDAEGIASYIAMFDEFIRGEAVDASSNTAYYETVDVLKVAEELVSKLGYRSADSHDESTKVLTRLFLHRELSGGTISKRIDELADDINFDCNRKEVVDQVDNIISWLLNDADTSEIYMHNLNTLASNKYVKWSDIGILASATIAYRKAMRFKKNDEEFAKNHEDDFKSEYVGNVGERITVNLKSVTCVYSNDTIYGMSFLYKMVDVNDNILMWSTSKSLDEEEYKSVTGTVKSQSSYRDIKQTYLTRCKLAAKGVD